jgi:hypothetical protein
MSRDQLARILGSGDGITTAKFAELWECSASKAYARLRNIYGMVATPVDGTGRIAGRYSHDIWQLSNYEEPGALSAALEAIFPGDRDTMGYHIVQTYPEWKMLCDRPDAKVSALDGPLGICTCHYDGDDWVLSILVDGRWQTHPILSTDDVERIVRESR